jgi:hypothetical protein
LTDDTPRFAFFCDPVREKEITISGAMWYGMFMAWAVRVNRDAIIALTTPKSKTLTCQDICQ